MKVNRPYILTIAGLDPSSGAGITSDIKTFEAHGLYGLSVCTAITVQNDIEFKRCQWISKEVILSQIDILFERFNINTVKIGIIENWQTLLVVLNKLHALNSEIKIILDPILNATAGFDFHSGEGQVLFDEIWKQCYIITPNYEEIQLLYPEKNCKKTIDLISSATYLYLKGGHRTDKKGFDELYHNGKVLLNIPPNTNKVSEKHGSGCVLSSSLACNIALGFDLENMVKNAKYYTEQFLNSNVSLLGTHKNITAL